MESNYESLYISRTSLLSCLPSIVPSASTEGSLNGSDTGDDTTDAAATLSAFLATATRARLVPRSMIKLASMSKVSSIGEGADYRVEVFRPEGQKPFVVKRVKAMIPVIKPGGLITVAAAPRLAKVLREMLITQHPPLKDNPNIIDVDAYGWDYVDSGIITPCLITEYAEHGTMRQYLRARAGEEPDERNLMWKGVAQGLLALHHCEIVHGDVKLDNVLITIEHVTRKIVPKLADFGSSIFNHPDIDEQPYLGTEIYNAPELTSPTGGSIIQSLAFDQLKMCDVYSFGLLVWETFKNGAYYVSGEDFHAQKSIAATDWRLRATQELQQTVSLTADHIEQISAVLTWTLSPNASERKPLGQLVENTEFDVVGGENMYQPLDVPDSFYLPFSDLGTFEGVLGLIKPSNFDGDAPATIPPWSVKVSFSAAIKQSCTNNDYVKSALAALNLAVCYYVGIGVEQDQSQTLHWLRESARQGCREARVLVRTAHEALCTAYEEVVSLETENDKVEQYLSTLEKATRKSTYTTPYFQLAETGVSIFWTTIPSQSDDDVLHDSALHGTWKSVSMLLQAGFQDHQDQYGQTALLIACRRGRLDIVKCLLESGSDPSIADDKGRTPLHMLVMFPEHQVATVGKLLLASGKADINAVCHRRNFERAADYWAYLNGDPLEWAVICGNRTVVRFLVAEKVDVLRGLFAAVSFHLDDIVSILLEAPHGDVNTRFLSHCFLNLHQSHPFRRMLMHGRDFAGAMLRTVNVLRREWNKRIAITKTSPETTDILTGLSTLQIGTLDPDLAEESPTSSHDGDDSFGIDEIGCWPVIKIASDNLSYQDADIVDALLPLSGIRSGETADRAIKASILGCMGSPFESNNRCAVTLVKAGFPLEAMAEERYAAIHAAAGSGNICVVKAILDQKASLVNLRSMNGEIALHHAVRCLDPLPITSLLLDRGADLTLTAYRSGETPLGAYIESGWLYSAHSMLPTLLDADKANTYLAYSLGQHWGNALHYAAWFASSYEFRSIKRTGMLKAVLQQERLKSLVDLPAGDGYNALLSVCHNVHLASARMLVNAGANLQHSTPKGLHCLDLAMFRTRAAIAEVEPSYTYAKRLPEAYELCLYLADLLRGSAKDEQYTSLHIAVFIGYTEEVERILSLDPKQVLARDGGNLKPRQLLLNSIYSQQMGVQAYLAVCDPEFARRMFALQRYLLKLEISVSGGLLKEDTDDESDQETYYFLTTTNGRPRISENVDSRGEDGQDVMSLKIPKGSGVESYQETLDQLRKNLLA